MIHPSAKHIQATPFGRRALSAERLTDLAVGLNKSCVTRARCTDLILYLFEIQSAVSRGQHRVQRFLFGLVAGNVDTRQ